MLIWEVIMMGYINHIFHRVFFLVLIILSPILAHAGPDNNFVNNLELLLIIVIILLILVTAVILLLVIYIFNLLNLLIRREQKHVATEEDLLKLEMLKLQKQAGRWLTRSTPLSEEESIMMDHDYDGIRELNNHLPPWWKALFYITMIWGFIYLLVYHVFNWMPSSSQEFEMEIARAKAEDNIRLSQLAIGINEDNVELMLDEESLAHGAEIFKLHCVVCHAEDGGGGIGPNMTDPYWIHGGSIKNLFWVIKYGVPAKGMISWQSQLNPVEIRDVASYILSLQGTEPANPKAPQGDLYEESNEVKNPTDPNTMVDTRPDIESVQDSLDDIGIGRGLFSGTIRFMGGGPGCITCHNVTEEGLPKGALIAPDLTNVYTRLDEPTLYKVILKPYHLTMQEAFQDKTVMDTEVDYLVSYFEYVGTATAHQKKRDERAAGFLKRIRKQ